MNIVEIRAYAGPNLYCYSPAVRMKLDLGSLVDTASSHVDGLTEQLVGDLPGLKKHGCASGEPGGFVKRLREGTYPAHIVEHVALELQTMLGYQVGYGKARATDIPGIYDVIVSCRNIEVAKYAVRSAVTIVDQAFHGATTDMKAILANLADAKRRYEFGPSTQVIVEEARARGIPCTRIGNSSMVMLGYGCHQRRLQAASTDLTSLPAADLASDKQLTKLVLDTAGIPVPRGIVIRSAEQAVDFFRMLGGPVVIKPCNGNQGRGVSVGLASEAEIQRAFVLAQDISAEVLVEEYVQGKQYRLLVVNGKLVGASERIVPFVTGDGLHTVKQLVRTANMCKDRGVEHEKILTKIPLDAVTLQVLARQNKSLNDIPKKGEIVILRDNANLSTGATAVDVTEFVHHETAKMAVRIARVIGLDIAGIDVVAYDIRLPLTEQGGMIIEVNAVPGLRMHEFPCSGKKQHVAAAIVNMLYPDHASATVPIIAITGTNGKTTTTRMVHRIYELAGYTVGMTTTEGVYIGEDKIIEGDTTGPRSAKAVLMDPLVEVAVLETARGGIVRGGLAFTACDIGVVTNISDDHLGLDGIESLEDLAHVKSLVVETVKADGYALLNADDPYVAEMAKRVRANVVYFSMQPDNRHLRRHLGAGGLGFFVKDGKIYGAYGCCSQEIIAIHDIPVTMGGIARHNIQNALIAAAVAYCGQIPIHFIRQGLAGFSQNPGRLHLFDMGNFRLVLDYGHNPAGFEAMVATVQQMSAQRLIGIICAPGDRRNQAIQRMGQIAGTGFDRLYIKEDQDLRGRKMGETAQLLAQGALSSGLARGKMKVVLDERQAVEQALSKARKGDLIVVFYEHYDEVLKVINSFYDHTQNVQGSDMALVALS